MQHKKNEKKSTTFYKFLTLYLALMLLCFITGLSLLMIIDPSPSRGSVDYCYCSSRPARLNDNRRLREQPIPFIDKAKFVRYKSIIGTCSLDIIAHSQTAHFGSRRQPPP